MASKVSSGFGDVDVKKRFAGHAIAALFPKPYTVTELAGMVKQHMPPVGDSPRN